MKIFYYKKIVPRIEIDFFVTGLGVREELSAYVDHFNGTNDYLMVFFYDEIDIEVNNQVTRYPAGTAILWDDGVKHYYGRNDRKWQHSWINFHGKNLPGILSQSNIELNQPFPFSYPGIFEAYLHRIYSELQNNQSCNLRILEYNFRCMIMETDRMMQTANCLHIPENILNCKKYIDANMTKEITVEQLAKIAFLSVPHFCAEFKKYLSIAPGAYQMHLRMQMAKYLLNNHNLQIRDIAEQIGYSDKFQFSKIFKKKIGLSPGEYRKSSQNE